MKKTTKISIVCVLSVLFLGLAFFSPTISAKTKFKTLSADKKSELSQGVFVNVGFDEEREGIEILDEGGAGEYVTPVSEAPFETTHIGVHWKQENKKQKALQISVRTSADGKIFSDWVDAGILDGEGRDGVENEENFSNLVGAWSQKFFQAKVYFSTEEKQKLKQITFTFLNSLQEEEAGKKLTFVPRITAQELGFVKSSPHGQEVRVISREEWGADESLRATDSGDEDWPRSYHGTRKLVLHHTAVADSNGETSLENNMATIRSMYTWHAVNNLWGDIGYNAVVDAAGNVYEGRYGTVGEEMFRTDPSADDVMVLDVEGAHSSSYNAGSFGVAAMGNFTGFELPEAQREGMKDVLAFVADSRGIDVQGNSDFLRYDGTWHENLNNVMSHRDVGSTECPGDLLYEQITAIKSEVDNLPEMPSNLHGFSAIIDGSSIEGRTVGSGTVLASWDDFAGASGYQYALEKVFGTVYDPQPWETAWINGLNSSSAIASEFSFETYLQLEPISQYVLYVRAMDADGKPLSTIEHVNFKTDELPVPDLVFPEVWITSPAEGYEAAEKENLLVLAGASDNVAVVKIEIFYDGKSKKICENSTSCETSVRMLKETSGSHIIEARAFDQAGNSASATVNFTKAGTTSGDDPTPDPEPDLDDKWCSPWPKCRR